MFSWLKYISLPIFSIIRADFFYVLAYHRIFPLPGHDYPFDEGTISAIPRDFEKQILFIKKRFHVINFSMLSDILSSNKPIPNNLLIITFDDGYADNHEIAFKILEKHRLTAVIFLSTSFINTGELFWFDKLTCMIKKIPQSCITFDSGKYSFEVTNSNRKQIRESIMDLFLTISNKERLRFLEQLEQQSKIKITPNDLELAKPLNWHQIKEMSDAGIEMGSHTVSHPFLVNLSPEDIMYELAESKRLIEEKISKQIKCIAYPAGYYDQRVVELAKICGYKFGVSYEHNVKKFNKNRLFTIPRIHVELDVNYSLFLASLLFPHLFVSYRS